MRYSAILPISLPQGAFPGPRQPESEGPSSNRGGRKNVQARDDIEGVESLNVMRRPGNHLLRLGNNVEDAGGAVDHRRAGNPDLRHDVPRNDITGWNGRHADGRVDEAALPEHARGQVVRIEGVHAVVFSCDKHHVARTRAGKVEPGDIKGLRVDVAVQLV